MRWMLFAGCLATSCTTAAPPTLTPTGEQNQQGTAATDSGVGTEDTGLAGPGLPAVDPPQMTAVWTAAEVGAVLEQALVHGLPDPRYEHDQYLELLSHGNEACPGQETYIDDRFVYGCNASSGYYYSGVSNYLLSDDVTDGVRVRQLEVNGDFLFRDAEDDIFEVGGHARIFTTWPENGDRATLWLEHSGTWLWEAHESWLRGGASGRFSMTLEWVEGVKTLTVEGAIGYGGVWMAFDDLVLRAGSCGWSQAGGAQIRDPSGAWHRVNFGGECGRCGEVTFDGNTPLGEACADVSPVAAELADAWEGL